LYYIETGASQERQKELQEEEKLSKEEEEEEDINFPWILEHSFIRIQSVQRKLAAITHEPSPDENIALKTVLMCPSSREEVTFDNLVSSVTPKQLRRTTISS